MEVLCSRPGVIQVDNSLLESTASVETWGYGRPKEGVLDSVDGGSTPVSEARPRCALQRAESCPNVPPKEQEKSGRKKTVTMAPRSRYLTRQGQYLTRKPLFASENRVSILKKPAQQEPSEQDGGPDGGGAAELPDEEEESLFLPREDTLRSSTSRPEEPSALWTSEDDLDPPLTTSDLQTCDSYEDPATGCELGSGSSPRRSLSSLPLDVRSLTVPLRPRWTSTLRSSSSSEPRGLSRTSGQRCGALHSWTALGGSARHCNPPVPQPVSPHQAAYWACAIPGRPPPCPDRKSPSWDPNKEYVDLLDYTYPLRPSSDPAERRCLSGADTLLQDSGIELDRLCRSTSPPCAEPPPATFRRDVLAGSRPRSVSDSKASSSRRSSVDQLGLSAESLPGSDGTQRSRWQRHHEQGGSSSVFIPTWRVLPPAGAPWDGEDEFRPLPDRLQETEALSRHVRSLRLGAGEPADASWETLAEEPLRAGEGSASEASGSALPVVASLESLRVVSSCVERLRGALLRELQKATERDQGDTGGKESLTQHIQMFSSNLEELILWLYRLQEKMEGLTAPAVDIDSVRSCLARYKSFQREVSTRQNLTAAVLSAGDALLHCMTSTSPVLRDTLALVERQSQVLEAHSEKLFSSILSAMDSLTDPRRSAEGRSPQEQNQSESGFLEQD
ncbi:centrosomal protein of 68 kDa-like [Scleropages formosus]|uniref:Centrosomal protein 68 n=1 Tax=Scleropages formosus TaxID=113540 RepID=A0A0P7WXU6_SCLFO|nr:centrosomal protein of 68 kDa [Scleropages formosus]KPP66600.1 centrosomal protein of 68 kDa-like [Scleropages formosus]